MYKIFYFYITHFLINFFYKFLKMFRTKKKVDSYKTKFILNFKNEFLDEYHAEQNKMKW